MATFKDSQGDTWSVSLTIGAVLRIKKESGGKFDLLEPLKGDLYQTLNSDFGEFYEVLWLLVEGQAKAKGVTAEQFGERIAANCLIDAQRVFFQEWSRFFHGLQRAAEGTALEKMVTLTEIHLEAIRKAVEEETQGLVEKVVPKLNETLNKECGNLRASLASILSPERSENSGT